MLIGLCLFMLREVFMIRRILMLAFVLLVFTMPTEAITLQELQTSPQFKLVHHHEFSNPVGKEGIYVYLNTYSVEPLHYAPPQYTLRGIYYIATVASYGVGIQEKQLTVEYDTNYSLATLIRSSRTMNPSPSMIALIQASEINSGLYMSDIDVARYEADGTVKWTKYSADTRKFPVNRNHRILYDLADAMFISVYQQHFDDIVVQ